MANVVYELALRASTARSERDPSAWAHPFKEGAPYSECKHSLIEQWIGFAGFDHGVNGARHLSCDGSVSFTAQIGGAAVRRDVALEHASEAVCGFKHRGLSGNPQSPT